MKETQSSVNFPSTLPPAKQDLLRRLVTELAQVSGVVALVLGGSYARGTQRAGSDLDVGLYYIEASPFAIADIRAIAGRIATHAAFTVTDFYEWGDWVNGGAWIETEAGKVDFLYRNLDQVQRTITAAQQGIVQLDILQQPPYGFPSVIYLAETAICLPLHDPQGHITALKRQVEVYPPRLEQALIGWLGIAEFSLLHAYTFAQAGDIYNTAGCLTRIASILTQVLFAVNKTYFISDKGALDAIAGFPKTLPNYQQELSGLLASPGASVAELSAGVMTMHALWQGVVALTEGRYQPRFGLPRP